MTDEEMAEEYENAQDYCGLLDVLFEEQYNQDYGGLSCYISPYIEQAYLAGLKAGRPEWNKVADGDYPPCEKGNYTINVLTNYGDIAYYDYNEDCWIAEPSSVEIDPPIAWCEIPKYTEE